MKRRRPGPTSSPSCSAIRSPLLTTASVPSCKATKTTLVLALRVTDHQPTTLAETANHPARQPPSCFPPPPAPCSLRAASSMGPNLSHFLLCHSSIVSTDAAPHEIPSCMLGVSRNSVQQRCIRRPGKPCTPSHHTSLLLLASRSGLTSPCLRPHAPASALRQSSSRHRRTRPSWRRGRARPTG